MSRRPHPFARTLVVLLALLAVSTFVLAATQALGAPSAAVGGRLPDLDQETPSDLRLGVSGPSSAPTYWLGFRSAVRNIGVGPFVIQGTRTFPASDLLMRADQIIRTDGAQPIVVSGVGELHYVRSSDHQHWHLVGFDHYELRRAGETGDLVSDRKTGFCLGDRYLATSRLLPGMPRAKVYRSRCGLGQTGLESIREGISVGYGDDYKAFLEYQDLPLTGLADGRYVLVHRVNADGRLHELTGKNNAASLLLELGWLAGKPSVRILARCPDTDRCDGNAPTASRSAEVRAFASGLGKLRSGDDRILRIVPPPK